MALVQVYGEFWSENDVFWGRRNLSGEIAGIPQGGGAKGKEVNFWNEVGVYALYKDFNLLYVGKATVKLGTRLQYHRNKNPFTKGRWNQFSWYGFRKVNRTGKLGKIGSGTFQSNSAVIAAAFEAMLIRVAKPPINSRTESFPNATNIEQVRSGKLPVTLEKQIHEIHELFMSKQ